MKMTYAITSILLCSVLAGCTSQPSAQTLTTDNLAKRGFSPALATDLPPESQADIKKAIGHLSGKGLKHLPSNAFQNRSTLLLSHNIAPSIEHPNGIPIEHLPPYRFELFSNGRECVLAYHNTKAVSLLENTQCLAIND